MASADQPTVDEIRDEAVAFFEANAERKVALAADAAEGDASPQLAATP